MDILIFLTILVVTFFTGSWIEKRHFDRIRAREQALPKTPVIQCTRQTSMPNVARTEMVYGSTVVGADFFKNTLAGLVSLFGGNIATIESVTERGRREALIRLKQQAPDADFFANIRYETASLNAVSMKKGLPQVEFLAYGTAIYLTRDEV